MTGYLVLQFPRSWFLPMLLALVLGTHAQAQTWPDRPLKIVVPFAAGATNDVVGRLLAMKLSQRLGQPVVVENKTGSGGVIGADSVAKARPDGYTLLLGNLSTMVIAPLVYAQVPYVPERDFVQIAATASAPLVLVVNASSPVKDIAQLVALARENPGRINFASPGTGTPMHLMGESLKMQSNIQITHVPYRGGAPAVVDLLGNNVQFMFDNLASLKQHIDRGALRAIAVTSSKRMASLPSVPTVAELGFPSLESTSWFTIAAPKQVPAAVVARLQQELAVIVREDDYREKLAAVGTEPMMGSGDAAARLVSADHARWSEVVKRAGVRVE
jgi:tripartite-type tricarboxylate transporter receptor subunit TctC